MELLQQGGTLFTPPEKEHPFVTAERPQAHEWVG
jgi:hypothetical protein